MARAYLGEFEHLVLLAILRLGDEAYAPAILEELEHRTGRPAASGSVYVTLDRLEAKGLLRSRLADAGGERYVSVTAHGLGEVRAARAALLALWRGMEGVLEKA